MPNFNGIYRGTVVGNSDPTGRGRVQVVVPSISMGGGGSWAPLCGPFSGPTAAPAVGTSVWVMYEGGNLDYPVVLGTLAGPG